MTVLLADSNPIMWIDLSFAIVMVLAGFVGGWWLGRTRSGLEADSRRAEMALTKLHELAETVADDVGQHTNRMREISSELSQAGKLQGDAFGEAVSGSVDDLVEANERLQTQLATAEAKLRSQADEIRSQAAAARTDALTGLNNRRAFDDDLNRRFAEWQRRGTVFSLLMVDVDYFKKFNDTHGHQAGDAVLQGVAATMRKTLREMDITARYGGEEFAAILPVTNLNEAVRAAERVRTAVEKACYEFDGKQLTVTISAGVAQVSQSDSPPLIVKRADEGLYASKKGGRNCVHLHDGEGCRPALEVSPAPAAAISAPAVDMPSFTHDLERRLARCKGTSEPLALMLIEIDEFKSLSDRLGSAVAETLIQSTAALIGAKLQHANLLVRRGNGQLVAMLPTTTLMSATEIAQQIRAGIADLNLAGKNGSLHATASVGLTDAMAADDAAAMIKRADAALFASKAAGRNCIHVHHNGLCEQAGALLVAC